MSLPALQDEPRVPAEPNWRYRRPRCAGCHRPLLREVCGYGTIDETLCRVLGGVAACRACTMALVAVGGDPETLERLAAARRGRTAPVDEAPWPRSLPAALAAFEASRIRQALAEGGSGAQAARLLGLHRTTLHEKMKRLRHKGLL